MSCTFPLVNKSIATIVYYWWNGTHSYGETFRLGFRQGPAVLKFLPNQEPTATNLTLSQEQTRVSIRLSDSQINESKNLKMLKSVYSIVHQELVTEFNILWKLLDSFIQLLNSYLAKCITFKRWLMTIQQPSEYNRLEKLSNNYSMDKKKLFLIPIIHNQSLHFMVTCFLISIVAL